MRMRDGKSISEISKQTSLSRDTIEKWIRATQGATSKHRRCEVSVKLSPFIAMLTQVLEVDVRRAKYERRSDTLMRARGRAMLG